MKEIIISIVMGTLTFTGMIITSILSANKNEVWDKLRERMWINAKDN